MNFKNQLLRFTKRYAHKLLRETFSKTKKSASKPGIKQYRNTLLRPESNPGMKTGISRNLSAKHSKTAFRYLHYLPPANAKPQKWDSEKLGLPPLSYTPDHDHLPDPGEIVWTWVPYEELDGRGKDRPVLVVSMLGDYIIFVQMTSQDHAPGSLYQDECKRWWLDIGTGDWDYQGRPSEARLDLLWIVHISQVRRMGGKLNENTYFKLVTALQKIHCKA